MRLHADDPSTDRYVVDRQARHRPDNIPTYEDFGW